MPDLAATLVTQDELDTEEDNINFLRADFSDEDEHTTTDDIYHSRRRMLLAMDAMAEPRVYTPAQLQELGELQEASDAARRTHRQYHGWAPGTSDDEEEELSYPRRSANQSSAALLDEHVMRRDELLRDRMRLRQLRDAAHNEWRDYLPREPDSRLSSTWDQGHNPDGASGNHSLSDSLRHTALLQAVRRNPHLAQRLDRSELQRYILDRERGDDRDRANPARPAESSYPTLSSQRRQMHREASVRLNLQHTQDLLEEQESHRNYLDSQLRHPQNNMPAPSENRIRRLQHAMNRRLAPPPRVDHKHVEDAIKYLERLRLCESEEEGQDAASEVKFGPGCTPDQETFIFNTQLLPPPPKSSFLRTGAVLSGTQHGASPTPIPAYTRLPSGYRVVTEQAPQDETRPPRNTSPVGPNPPNDTNSSIAQTRLDEDRWHVKVTINSIDSDEMTLTGTMEAFDVPDKASPSPSKRSSITTYLEGEIIDFNAFTLETESFKSNTDTDSTYWRKLPPFKDMADDDTMVRNLLNREWLEQDLMQNWILMRWKGIFLYSLSHNSCRRQC